MFQKVADSEFLTGEHQVLKFWAEERIFEKLREKNRGKKRWSFLDGPITANNPMGVHHAWGRTYKDAFQRYFAMTGHDQRYQNGFDCQGLWVEVEVEKELNLGTKTAIHEFGIDRFVNECKKRVLNFAARQTEQSIRLGYWTDWDDPDTLRLLAEKIGTDEDVTITTPSGRTVTDRAHHIVAKLGNPEWGGSYFTFSTENNETIWTFLKKCFRRGKIYRGYDVMPWSGRAGSAYSQMEVADGRKLTVHRSCFVRFPITSKAESGKRKAENPTQADDSSSDSSAFRSPLSALEYLLVWTTTPWTLTSNVACAVNPDLEYVKLKTKRDNAIYYFAKDNLDYKRLDKEFKEGFGGPDWKWPKDVPKLKTIAQIFKEQGGCEVLGTLKGAEMVGWTYEGPFDELPAQQQPGGYPDTGESGKRKAESGEETQADDLSSRSSAFGPPLSALDCHRVIDGGRDNKGNPHVVAGEGTGIVHIAPGCGDVDHELGEEHGLVGIAPLGEDGTFGEGFGPFTGKEAIAPETAQLVFDTLKENHKLVYVEQYPHIYPHCWRTGDELVFRLVDEWFINMDWRDEIKEVVKAIRWLPDSVQGQERELEWLTNMRDWMISKKRFWGLALPIWVNPDDPSDFEVMGSLAELNERAVDGWDDFAGNTPHRPWIDRVKIKSEKTGAVLSRIVDVGNPWLDAGIVPFSTMPKEGPESRIQSPGPESASRLDSSHSQPSTLNLQPSPWYPADFVTECFPGQFRNWFYSLLALATMMRYDETDDPAEKRPFKTLLGHRLVMNEQGRQMHKTDGTAIWFEEAAEQLGVDTIRWLYLAQNPAQDLRFGTRHPDEPVKLNTPVGIISETSEGLPTCKVTSTPADEVRRQVLIPLWNSYAFFVNYARLDEFDPNSAPVPVADRPEIDRWILSNLQALIQKCREAFETFDTPSACAAAAEFIDDLSNWYIRRNRRRFWRSKDATDIDKLAAYQTLYEVLVALTKVLAPMVPFLSERMYQNLAVNSDNPQSAIRNPQSVHLCDYPLPDDQRLDPDLNSRMAVAQRVVKLGHKLREESNLRVRQPLGELRYTCGLAEQLESVDSLGDVIREELNVKRLTPRDNLDDLVSYSFKPNLKTLGPKYGKMLGAIRRELPEMDPAIFAPLRNGQAVIATIAGNEITLHPDDVLISTEPAADWVCADDRGIQVALSTALTPELQAEGIRNDFIRHVQQCRKNANLEIKDRIHVFYHTKDAACGLAVEQWSDDIKLETLADSIAHTDESPDGLKPVTVGDAKARVWIERA
ncbi:MAG: class I tRNA ligase family protein [Planctomycetaceae bacterium]